MINNLKQVISRNLINIPGFRTSRKIVVFESDDWGMIRMASKEALKEFEDKGYNVKDCAYNSNDRIESNADLEALISVLNSVRDCNNNPAKFTLNNIVANPDFKKIEDSGFNRYYFEPFTNTLKKYADTDRVMDLYREGINKNVFQIQFHGREHINVELWMRRLQQKDEKTIQAFKKEMFSVHKSGSISGRAHALDAFGNKFSNDVIIEGADLFYKIWGFHSKSFIAPCYTWYSSIEPILKNNGILYIQGSNVQISPKEFSSSKFKKISHYTGQRNKIGQIYLVRNASFEPTAVGKKFDINNTLKEIEISFRYRKPVIITTHRVNYIGSLNSENRTNNLLLLKNLLKAIIKKWPSVEFMSSDDLGDFISQN